MVLEQLAKGHQQTRDSVGSNPDVIPIAKLKNSEVNLWSEPHIVFDRDINNSWIVGSSTNGIVGTNTGTAGGGQQVVGGTTNTQTLLRVSCNSNRWVNFLRDTPTNQYDDSVDYGLVLASESTASTINTSTFRFDLDTGESIAWRISYNDGTISFVTPVFDESAERTNMVTGQSGDSFPMTFPFTLGGAANVDLEFSTDGVSWDSAQSGVETALTTPGHDLWMRITALEDGVFWKTTNDSGVEVPLIVRFR